MKYNKIFLAGGNGYLGQVLANYYWDKADEIVILARHPHVVESNIRTIVWDGVNTGAWTAELEGADLLINLCGKNVNCRYTAENREELLQSRIKPTRLLGEAIAGLTEPPKLWINLSSATMYRHAEDRPQDEDTGEIGYGMSIDICKQWEEVFFNADTPRTRKVALRMGIVLGRKGGAWPRLYNLVRLGLGGKQGDGEQYISWIHEHDAARVTEWLLNYPDLDGVVNCTAPVAIKNRDFMRTFRRLYNAPLGLPAPAWLLAIGAKIIGTETELILKSRWVTPKRLLDDGFEFHFPYVHAALADILSIRI